MYFVKNLELILHLGLNIFINGLLYFVVDCTNDETATPTDLAKLASKIEIFMERFASELDAELFTFSKIKKIQRENNTPFMQASAMLDTWKCHHAEKAYRRLLIQALINIDNRLAANEVFGEAIVRQVSPQQLN